MRAYLLRYGTKVYWRLRLARNRVVVDAPVSVRKNIPYHGRLRKSHKLDIYQPAGKTNLPVVVFMHGGGWVMGDKFERRDFARELAAQGFMVVLPNHRLSPEFRFPAGAVDGLRAMEWVKNNIANYGGDPENIILGGDSSGAHIAAVMACAAASKKLQNAWGVDFPVTARAKKTVLYYGVYNLRADADVLKRKYFKTYIRAYLGTKTLDGYKYADYFSPVEYAGADFPQTLLIASEADPLCNQSLEMAEVLARHKVHTELLLLEKSDYPHAIHGFLADAATPHTRRAFAAVIDFLKDK